MRSLTAETTYKFFVDGNAFTAHTQFLTGEDVRRISGVDKRLRLFIGEQGAGHPDRPVLRDQRVNLGQPGEEKFYTLEPPSMDIC